MFYTWSGTFVFNIIILKTCHVHIKVVGQKIGSGQGFILIDFEIVSSSNILARLKHSRYLTLDMPLFYLTQISKLIVHREASSFSEGELLEPQQMMLPQGVGPSTSAGHIQVYTVGYTDE